MFDLKFDEAQQNLLALTDFIKEAERKRALLADEIEQLLRLKGGISVNPDAIAATVIRPYTLLPINDTEAWLIHWRGVAMPIVGWVVAQEPAFIKARVTRSMDAITPLPQWLKTELGWKPPEHQASIDGTRTAIRLTAGNEAEFKKRYGAQLGKKQADGTYRIKAGDAWIKLVAALIKDGILPYQPQPVAPEHWNAKAKSPIELRRYQEPAVAEFLAKGAVLINYPPGAGKSFIASYILSHFIGRVLLLCDSTVLVEQWRDFVKQYAPGADVTISTYQGAGKYLDRAWDLVIFDEAHRLPANTFSKLAFIKTTYRIGLSGTAWREDGRIHLIAALSGFPVHIPWAELIAAGVLQKPRVIVAIVPNDAAKTRYVKALVDDRRGRALVYCDWLQQGAQLADALDVPFINGSSANKLASIREAEVCVVSRVADRGIDLDDLNLVIEVGFLGGSREQYAQRLGRLLHSKFKGAFYTVFTEEEARQYRSRIFGAQAEMAGQVDVEFIYVDGSSPSSNVRGPKVPRSPGGSGVRANRQTTGRTTRATHRVPRQALAPVARPTDEIGQIMARPAIRAKLTIAAKGLSSDQSAWVAKTFRACFVAPYSAEEMVMAEGKTGASTVNRCESACKALVNVGLFVRRDGGRYAVDQSIVNSLRALGQ